MAALLITLLLVPVVFSFGRDREADELAEPDEAAGLANPAEHAKPAKPAEHANPAELAKRANAAKPAAAGGLLATRHDAFDRLLAGVHRFVITHPRKLVVVFCIITATALVGTL